MRTRKAVSSEQQRQIINVPVDTLNEYEGNSRLHSDTQIEEIKNSIKEFGFVNPILIGSDNVIIAGHGRLSAAKILGLKEVPCLVLDHLTEAQKRAYVIADNKLAENASWDYETLSEEIIKLQDDNFDTSLLGFEEDTIDALINFDFDQGVFSEDKEEREESEGSKEALSEKYTRNIKPPVYEPKGEDYKVTDLYSDIKAQELLEDIEASDQPEDIKEFLSLAALRHVEFNYQRIAEYYCNADKKTQELMEDSALVIIDLKSAIEKGYTTLTKDLLEECGEGKNNDE